jgi:hypothetical protein
MSDTPSDPPEGGVTTIVPPGSEAREAAQPYTEEVLDIDPEVAERRGGPEQEVAQVRETLGVTENVDPLQALLNAPTGPQTGTWFCKRLNVNFQIKSLDNDVYGKVQEESTRFVRNRRTGRMEKDIDSPTMSMLVCAYGTTTPSFTSQTVLKRYNAASPRHAVKAALLPGEVDKLAEKILNLSGYDEEDDLEEAGKD